MLKSLSRELNMDPHLQKRFNKTLLIDVAKHFAKLDWMSGTPPDKFWWLPQHTVHNPDKPSKIRKIANTASKIRGPSLTRTCPQDMIYWTVSSKFFSDFANTPLLYLLILNTCSCRLVSVLKQNRHFVLSNSLTIAIFALNKCAEDSGHLFPKKFRPINNNLTWMTFGSFSDKCNWSQKDIRTSQTRVKKVRFKLTKFITTHRKVLKNVGTEIIDVSNEHVGDICQKLKLKGDIVILKPYWKFLRTLLSTCNAPCLVCCLKFLIQLEYFCPWSDSKSYCSNCGNSFSHS